MSLPVIAILTSASCGHCRSMRGDGQPREPSNPSIPGPIKGGHHWSPTFFRRLITGNKKGEGTAKWRVFEFYFPTLRIDSIGSLLEANEFNLKPGGITRTTYMPTSDGTSVMRAFDGGKKTALDGAGDFKTWVAKRYPKELINFVYLYPGWIWTSGPNWDAAVKGTEHMFSHVSACFVDVQGKDDAGKPIYGVNYEKKFTTPEDPLEVAITLNNASPKLHPPKENTEQLPLPTETVRMQTAGCSALGFRLVGD